MSTRGTIFLTNLNEHVYDETLNWSIVFEIDEKSIEKITYRWFNKKNNRTRFRNLRLKENDYIVIQTRSYYDFIDSWKNYIFDKKEFYFSQKKNNGQYLIFRLEELANVDTEEEVYFDKENNICKLWDIEIKLKKDSEWLQEYKKHLLKYIENREKYYNGIKYIVS